MNNKDYSGAGTTTLSLPVIVTLIFVILKLCNVIKWSWWWVLSPLWIGVAIWILVGIGAFIFYMVTRKK